ncbi:basic leucine zipper transcriptional factor ATF-like [Bombina bombina]|uniref:basic leucine zipper transcriptional factor ATF-like n=1 Tax=Bombina bombina TaxID=8345 RepID=UPI00235AE6E8|nr:basic leucine zipper transcriptional factor ATF-like [Bombina bombina]
MHPDSDSTEQDYSSSSCSSTPQDCSDDTRKLQRREKNRIAAQKSRLRQTEKADLLHIESESLEGKNTALHREIRVLREEIRYLTCVLNSHMPACVLAEPKPASFQPHVSSSRYPD